MSLSNAPLPLFLADGRNGCLMFANFVNRSIFLLVSVFFFFEGGGRIDT